MRWEVAGDLTSGGFAGWLRGRGPARVSALPGTERGHLRNENHSTVLAPEPSDDASAHFRSPAKSSVGVLKLMRISRLCKKPIEFNTHPHLDSGSPPKAFTSHTFTNGTKCQVKV